MGPILFIYLILRTVQFAGRFEHKSVQVSAIRKLSFSVFWDWIASLEDLLVLMVCVHKSFRACSIRAIAMRKFCQNVATGERRAEQC
jgi:hypothetical protein